MLARASFAAVLAACAVLLASSAIAWPLSGKPSASAQSDRVLPLSNTGTPEHVQDHYWWNVKTGIVICHPAFCADPRFCLVCFWVHHGGCTEQSMCFPGAVQWTDPNPVHRTGLVSDS